ncbi:hypothetical protein DMN91_002181 [Ooceraea biroi]|uniref:GIY-YIG domain-containing protein n=1 Tax=Ooceraea biroi TaxID=2015173 RepID=A0A3L8E1W7_OOCBI|nr:hypothetical protein DMN91_002181 [Ooceraea biroi]
MGFTLISFITVQIITFRCYGYLPADVLTLPNPKDWRSPVAIPGVYNISCTCGKVYIGETEKKISTRIKNHQRCANCGHCFQSAVAEHWMETGDSVQYDNTTILSPTQGYFAENIVKV